MSNVLAREESPRHPILLAGRGKQTDRQVCQSVLSKSSSASSSSLARYLLLAEQAILLVITPLREDLLPVQTPGAVKS